MTGLTRFLYRSLYLGVVTITVVIGLATGQARAQICCAGDPNADDTYFAILYTGDPHTLYFSNSTVNSNIGIGDNGGFIASGSGTINGTVEFAAPNTGQFNLDDSNIIVTGGATYNNANVQADLNALTATSQRLSTEAGTSITLTGGGTLNASRGMLDGTGNLVFTATIDRSFKAGTTFTVNGTSNQFVVINIPSTGGLGFDASIVLTGGITPDHVLFNFDAGNFDTLSGGDPLMIDTALNTTTGTFLDPNGALDISSSVIDGRIFGGDTLDATISGSSIVAPPPFQVPEPTSLALFGAGLIAFGIIRRRHRTPMSRP